jgi:hypothetical protein
MIRSDDLRFRTLVESTELQKPEIVLRLLVLNGANVPRSEAEGSESAVPDESRPPCHPACRSVNRSGRGLSTFANSSRSLHPFSALRRARRLPAVRRRTLHLLAPRFCPSIVSIRTSLNWRRMSDLDFYNRQNFLGILGSGQRDCLPFGAAAINSFACSPLNPRLVLRCANAP